MKMHAMILAGDKLVVGGVVDGRNPKDGVIWILSVSDGKKLKEIGLDSPPVYEGMTAAYGRVYVSTADGRLLCFGKE